MTDDAQQLLDLALKKVSLRSGFSPVELGAKIGLNKFQAETAARLLANAGVLVLGFDLSAEFSSDFRKSRTPAPVKPAKLARVRLQTAVVSRPQRRRRAAAVAR